MWLVSEWRGVSTKRNLDFEWASVPLFVAFESHQSRRHRRNVGDFMSDGSKGDAAPAEIVQATEAAASQDYSSVSQVIRQALAGELKRRGLLAERV
jgi:hypothetical protein